MDPSREDIISLWEAVEGSPMWKGVLHLVTSCITHQCKLRYSKARFEAVRQLWCWGLRYDANDNLVDNWAASLEGKNAYLDQIRPSIPGA